MTTELAIAPVTDTEAALAEQVVIKGNLAQLTEQQRMDYYGAVCRSLGLNPLTRPFEYITLNNKLTLYATRGCADQLRAIRGITITSLEPRQVGDLLVVVATGRDRSGREDSSTGAVATQGLRGEALANAMMKAETKAKRRLTLSLAGLGWSDETEVETIPNAERVDPPKVLSLAEKAAAKAAEVTSVEGEATEQVAPGQASLEDAIAPTGELTLDEFRVLARDKFLGTAQVKPVADELFGRTFRGDPSTWGLTGAEWQALAVELGLVPA